MYELKIESLLFLTNLQSTELIVSVKVQEISQTKKTRRRKKKKKKKD
jgi:hypothetical protein